MRKDRREIMNKLKRYILFLIGLFVNALGVSLVTKASLGTSPISSIPYVLSLNFPFTLGNFTIVFSILLIVLQILILRKNFKLENILQIPVSIAFGYFIDLTMYMLFWIKPQSYFVKMIALLAGCLVLGFGVYLEVLADSVNLACLPVKDCYNMLYRGDRVVVAEFAIHPADSVDSVWVKLAHSQEVQGWLRESEMMHAFVPTDSISQAIYLFSDTHASYFIIIFALFVTVWLFRAFRRKQLRMVYFNDIDSLYPLLLCLLMAFCATIYESIQVFAPETWQHFYFNPTLSPFKVPFVLSAFLMGFWLFIVVLLAVLDDLFRQLSPAAAVFYLLGLASCCIFCYFFFILTTSIYVGYLFLAAFVWVFLKRLRISLLASRYRCGRCGQKLREKGVCPHCGAINE